MKIFTVLLSTAIAYLLGCVNAALMYSKLIKKEDIRNFGSGNAGSTNILRVYGLAPALLVFTFDFLKGFSAVKICEFLNGGADYALIFAVIAVVSGHNWPIFTNYRGGKGVATTFGVGLAIAPYVAVAGLVGAIIIVFVTHIMALGTVTAISLCSILLFILKAPYYHSIPIAILALFSIYQHRGNIKRIINGTENKLEFSKKRD